MKSSLINVDDIQLAAENIYFVQQVCEVTKTLNILYGRRIAQKYFNSHVKFDTISLTTSFE